METRIEIREVVSTVVSSLRTSIHNLDRRNVSRNPPTIHQIPIYVRKGNESAYAPTFVSIGPYHRDLHEQTRGMKISYLKNFLDRTGKDMEKYASRIESREEEARDCYHDRCNGLGSKEFVQMLVLDGCFIVELLLKFNKKGIRDWFLFKMHNTNDLMLMENQIPFFILRLILYDSGLPDKILDLCLPFLHGKNIQKNMLEPTHREGDGENVYHLLHLSYLCHMAEIIPEMESPPKTLRDRLIEQPKRVFYFIAYVFLLPIKCFRLLLSYFRLFFFYALVLLLEFIKIANKIMRQKPCMHKRQKVKAKEEKKPRMIPTATELNEFGVTFKRKKDAKNSIDVSFENGIMEIPEVLIKDSSSSEFRNYLALERNCPEVGNKFTSYAVFMNNLVDTASDVALLKKRKIIVSMLECDEEVAKSFNEIAVGLVFNYYSHYVDNIFKDVGVHCENDHNKLHYFDKIFKDVGVHCAKDHNKLQGKVIKWRAMLMRDYFSSPWSIISLFGAFTLLAFSATQVVYAIKRSHKM